MVDLRGHFGGFQPFDQGQLGSCTANAISAAIIFTQLREAHDKTPNTVPARLGIYFYERKLEGTVMSDAGAQIRDGIKVVNKTGYVDEKLWPYDVRTFTQEVHPIVRAEHVYAYKRIQQNVTHMMAALAEGLPFVFGISVYSSFFSAPKGDVPMPKAHERVEGGHALLCVGYDAPRQRFIFLNSWGAGWGQGGYGTIPFDYLADPNLADDMWRISRET